MCAVSMIYDYYGRFSTPNPFPQFPIPIPSPQPIPWGTGLPTTLPWDRSALDDLKEILRRLDALDKKLGLEACEDPKKAEWMKVIEDRLARLEEARP